MCRRTTSRYSISQGFLIEEGQDLSTWFLFARKSNFFFTRTLVVNKDTNTYIRS